MKFYTLLQTVFLVGILTTLAEGTNDASCSLDQLNIIPGDGVATITPIATIPIATDDGSLKTTVSCDVSGIADAITYMNFQNGIGGPTDPASLISADLFCSNGSWTFNSDGRSTEITEVKCLYSGPNLPCGVCTPNSITFTPATGSGTVGSYWRNYAIDTRGCPSLTAVCPASPLKGSTFMQFNGHIGGVFGLDDTEATASLNCVNGTWQFTGSGITTEITVIDCFVA